MTYPREHFRGQKSVVTDDGTSVQGDAVIENSRERGSLFCTMSANISFSDTDFTAHCVSKAAGMIHFICTANTRGRNMWHLILLGLG